MKRNWQLLRLMDLYRCAGHMRRMTVSMASEIRYLEYTMQIEGAGK